MLLLKKKTVKSAFEELIPRIIKDGESMVTEDNQKCKEIMNVIIEITDPSNKNISSKYPLGERAIKSYTEQLLNGSSAEFVYDYHGRLFEYPLHKMQMKNEKSIKDFDDGQWTTGTMVELKNNQIDYIINKLKNQNNSRRAIAITWDPEIDQTVKDVPCLQFIEFLIRDNKLYQTVLFRSNDAFLAFHANAIGLIALGEVVAEKLGLELAKYTHHSVSMHVYSERDMDALSKF